MHKKAQKENHENIQNTVNYCVTKTINLEKIEEFQSKEIKKIL